MSAEDPVGPPPGPGDEPGPGSVLGPLTVGPIAHGGHCVARHQGRVIFVRHALPGEQVLVELTDTGHDRFWRADAIEIVVPSADRVPSRCPISGPGGCGGCDFQHVDLAAQRRLKAVVLAEQLQRLAGLQVEAEVEEVPAEHPDGLDWRTRVRYLADADGRYGLRAHRSHRVIGLPDGGCRIARPGLAEPPALTTDELTGVEAADGLHWIDDDQRSEPVRQRAIGRDWTLNADGFWQVHPAAADLLADTVRTGLHPRPGETALDLYCGVGLFSGMLADAGCRVTGVETDRIAVGHARANLADARDRTRFVAGRADRVLSRPPGRGAPARRFDLVVLDPPRSGAGRRVIDQIVRRSPRAIAYVACDPAALARDLGYLDRHGYRLDSLRAFDLFPMTHHLECVAVVRPDDRR